MDFFKVTGSGRDYFNAKVTLCVGYNGSKYPISNIVNTHVYFLSEGFLINESTKNANYTVTISQPGIGFVETMLSLFALQNPFASIKSDRYRFC